MRIDLTSVEPKVTGRITGTGVKSHGLVLWRNEIITLDSENSALVSVAMTLGRDQKGDIASHPKLLWKVNFCNILRD